MAGMINAAMMAIMAITTKSSISVNADIDEYFEEVEKEEAESRGKAIVYHR
jgi:hypothetical protein